MQIGSSASPARAAAAPVSRRRVPLLGDMVTVSSADAIRAFEADPDVARPGDARMPAWFGLFMRASKFYCPQTRRWFIGFVGGDAADRAARMRYVVERIDGGGYTRADAEDAARLLRTPGSSRALSALCTRMVGRLYLDDALPDDVCAAAMDTVLDIPAGPVRYFTAWRAQAKVYKHVAARVPAPHVEDVCHNLGAAAHGVLAALEALRTADAGGGGAVVDPWDALFRDPTIKTAVRVARGAGTVGGLLDAPLVPEKTLIFLAYGAAATKERDDSFLFGPGSSARQCPFKGFFFKFAGEVAAILAETRPA